MEVYITPIDLPHELYVTEVVTIRIPFITGFPGPTGKQYCTVVFSYPGLIENFMELYHELLPPRLLELN